MGQALPDTQASSSTTSQDSKPPSEHTLRAWLAVLGAFFAFFCSVGFVNAFGVFQEYYRSHQLSNHSDFDISWIGSFAIFIIFGSAPITGILFDHFGPTLLLTGGSLALLLAIFMTSLCTEYYQFFLAQAFLLGGSMSFLFCPALATVSRYFQKNKGLAMGITVGGSSTGGVIWPIVLNELLTKDGVSFGWVMRIIGFIMIPILMLVIATIRLPLQVKNDDERVVTREKAKHDFSILKNTTFILLCAGLAIFYLGMFAPFFYISSYTQSLGHSVSISFYLVSVVNAASLFGRILPGILADRYGRFNMCFVAALASGVTAFCWMGAKSIAGLVVWSLAYGFASGAIMSLQSACAAQLATPSTHGTAVGFLSGSGALTALFGTPICGQLVGSYGYLSVSMYSGATLIAGSFLVLSARLSLDKNILARH